MKIEECHGEKSSTLHWILKGVLKEHMRFVPYIKSPVDVSRQCISSLLGLGVGGDATTNAGMSVP